MATLPENVNFGTQLEYVSQPSQTWLINRETMRVQSDINGLEAVKQAVDIILSTDRFEWQIYTSNMGSELKTLIGEETSYIVSEFPRMIEDALSVDSRIIEVSDFNYTVNGDSMLWTFTVRTVYGDFGEEVMI
jgi:hypothetical protein